MSSAKRPGKIRTEPSVLFLVEKMSSSLRGGCREKFLLSLTLKALANFSPGLARSATLGQRTEIFLRRNPERVASPVNDP
jgi:hypothetical protein